jgi:hypothetical protein
MSWRSTARSCSCENADKVDGIASMYPMCDIASYPGFEKAAAALMNGSTFKDIEKLEADLRPAEANLSAIVCLYRAQNERFVALVQSYLASIVAECAVLEPAIDRFESALVAVRCKVDSGLRRLRLQGSGNPRAIRKVFF